MYSIKTYFFIFALLASALEADPCEELDSDEYGEKKDNYVLGRKIGEGSYGIVFSAFEKKAGYKKKSSNDFNLALKFIKQSSEDSEDDFLVNLNIEADFMMKVNQCQKNERKDTRLKIAPTFFTCATKDNGEAFIVQELCSYDLKSPEFKKRYLGWLLSEKLDFFIKLLSKIDSLHSCRIIHCDIKPANILVTRDEDDYLYSDFGLSTFRKSCPGSTNFYAPYEYFKGVDMKFEELAKHDVFALGVMFLDFERWYTKKRLPNVDHDDYDKSELLQDKADDIFDKRKEMIGDTDVYEKNLNHAERIIDGMNAGIQKMLELDPSARWGIRYLIPQFAMLRNLAGLIENGKKVSKRAFEDQIEALEEKHNMSIEWEHIRVNQAI